MEEQQFSFIKDEARRHAISEAMKEVEKSFGKGSIMWLGEKHVKPFADVISTGSLALDIALGIGGVPRGRIVEIFGPDGSGKTTIALHILAEAQKQGGVGLFIDAEHALDPYYAKNIGVNIDNLLISQPDAGEEAIEIAETFTRSGGVDVIIVDSVAALVPRAEIEGEMTESQVGIQARLMSKAMRKLVAAIAKTKVCAIFLNQLRYKIGIMFGSPFTTTGGLALKFHASVRVEITGTSPIKKGEEKIGIKVNTMVKKNKLAPPLKEATFDIIYGKGIRKEGDIVDLGLQYGIITKSGNWLSYKDEKMGQGRENAIEYLISKPDLAKELETEIRKKVFGSL